MVDFYGAKSVPPTSSIKMRKCQKKLARVYVYTRAYTQIRERGGLLGPPPLIGLIIIVIIVTKDIMALMLKVVIKDRCVLKKWAWIVIGHYGYKCSFRS